MSHIVNNVKSIVVLTCILPCRLHACDANGGRECSTQVASGGTALDPQIAAELMSCSQVKNRSDGQDN